MHPCCCKRYSLFGILCVLSFVKNIKAWGNSNSPIWKSSIHQNKMKEDPSCRNIAFHMNQIVYLTKGKSSRFDIKSTLTLSLKQTEENQIQVWDGVITNDICEELHELAWDHNDRVESSIFTRRRRKKCVQSEQDEFANAEIDKKISKKWTNLEQAIDSIITAIEENSETDLKIGKEQDENDDLMVVEYWSRQNHMPIDVHSDIDEIQLLEDGTIRTPKFGHILYLIIGDEIKKSGGAPTIIFPDNKKTWNNGNEASALKMVAIPAVSGRLVRFDGRMMHAVPCPAMDWLENNIHDVTHTDRDDDDIDEDDLYDVDNEYLRSVLIFNTWPSSEGPPPKGVDPDPQTSLIPSGIELGGIDLDIGGDEKDESNYSDDSVACNLFTKWKNVVVPSYLHSMNNLKDSTENCIKARLPLMGKVERRGNEESFVNIVAPASMKTALTQQSAVSEISALKTNTE